MDVRTYAVITERRSNSSGQYVNLVIAETLDAAVRKVMAERDNHRPVAVSIANAESHGLEMAGGIIKRLIPPREEWTESGTTMKLVGGN